MGERIRALRKSKNLTQEQLAEKLGISSKAISDYENDKVLKPNALIIQAIADYFNVSVDYLLKGDIETHDTQQTY